jgi:hypothetical protein
MTDRQFSFSFHGFFLASFIVSLFVFASCNSWQMPKELAGRWSSRQPVTVRYSTGFLSYKFVKDTVDIVVDVDTTGAIKGRVGNAQFTDCAVEENRGWFGRTFHLATDYVFKGKLVGSIFPADTIVEKNISAPFNVNGSLTKGSLFHKEGIDLYPLLNFELKKQ